MGRIPNQPYATDAWRRHAPKGNTKLPFIKQPGILEHMSEPGGQPLRIEYALNDTAVRLRKKEADPVCLQKQLRLCVLRPRLSLYLGDRPVFGVVTSDKWHIEE